MEWQKYTETYHEYNPLSVKSTMAVGMISVTKN